MWIAARSGLFLLVLLGCDRSGELPHLAPVAAAYERAQIAGDAATLSSLVADDYVLIASGGSRLTKAALIAYWTDPGLAVDPVHVAEPVQHAREGLAVLGGSVELTGAAGGVPFQKRLRYVDVWELRDGRWQVVYGQVTAVAR